MTAAAYEVATLSPVEGVRSVWCVVLRGPGATGTLPVAAFRDRRSAETFMSGLCRMMEMIEDSIASAEREACAAVALADIEAGPGRVEASQRFDGGSSEKTALRIAAAIRGRKP